MRVAPVRDSSLQPYRILILTGDIEGNLGDRAILMATCDALRRAYPDIEVTILAPDADTARRDFGAHAVRPGLRHLGAQLRAAVRSDRVLVGGGGLFQDDDSLLKMPYWAARVALARLAGARLTAHALGVGPLDALPSRLAARLAFACMDAISVRDERAKHVARSVTRKPVTVVPDPALALRPVDSALARAALAEADVPLDGRPLLGVAPRRWFPPRRRVLPHKLRWRIGLVSVREDPGSKLLMDRMAEALQSFLRRHHGHVVLLPTYCAPQEGDDALCEELRVRLPAESASILRLHDPRLYQAVTGQLDAMLGGRMHPMILAASMGTPTVGLAYNPKFFGFMESIGRADAVIDVQTFVQGPKVEALASLIDEAVSGGRQSLTRMAALADHVETHCRQLAADLP